MVICNPELSLAVAVERRVDTRYWCSDLVHVSVKDGARWKSAGVGVLEDISSSGACIQMETPVKKGLAIRFRHPEWKAEGTVLYCHYREIGYFVGMRFNEGAEWSPEKFQPKHMVDPNEVVTARLQRRVKAAGAGR